MPDFTPSKEWEAVLHVEGHHAGDAQESVASLRLLNRPEQLWLSACWEASGALKAVREQIREERRR